MRLVSTLHITRDRIYPPEAAPVTLLANPRDVDDEEVTGFAIVEAKSSLYPSLGDAVPQAVLEVAAFAKKHK